MHGRVALLIMATSLSALLSAPALAYIGPGAGITMLGALWGVLVAIVLAFGALLLWPIRILLRRNRNRNRITESEEETLAESSEPDASDAGDEGGCR